MVGLAELVRPFEPRDRAIVEAMLGGSNPIDDPNVRLQVAVDDAGGVQGVATWTRPNAVDGFAELGAVVTGPVPVEVSFHRLMLACVEEAMAEGVTHGRSTVRRRGLVEHFERVFGLTSIVVGRRNGQPSEWVFAGALEPFRARLRELVT